METISVGDRQLRPFFQDLLAALFEEFSSHNISTVILRGGNKLPKYLTGNDIDIFVQQCNLKDAKKILIETARSHHLEIIHKYHSSYFSAYWILDPSRVAAELLHVDLYPGAFTWKGLKYLSDQTILASIQIKNKFPFPATYIEIISLLLTSLLWGGFLKTKYIPQLKLLLSIDSEARATVTEILRSQLYCNDDVIKLVESNEINEIDVNTVKKVVKQLRTGLIKSSFQKNPIKAIKRMARYFLGELIKWVKPAGIQIAIYGPDGIGKSLLIQNIIDSHFFPFGEIVSCHWRPSILPDIGILLGKRSRRNNEVHTNPHENPPHGFLFSYLRLIYYLIDYWIGFFTKIWPSISRNKLVIFDRYIFDMAIDPLRYRLSLPSCLIQFLCRFSPKPDLSLIMLAPPEVIQSRKQEVSDKELIAILSRLRKLAYRNPRFILIDGSQNPELVFQQVSNHIITYLAHRK